MSGSSGMHQTSASGSRGNGGRRGRKPNTRGGTGYGTSRTGRKAPPPQESAEEKAFSDYIKSITNDQVYDLTEQIDDLAGWQHAYKVKKRTKYITLDPLADYSSVVKASAVLSLKNHQGVVIAYAGVLNQLRNECLIKNPELSFPQANDWKACVDRTKRLWLELNPVSIPSLVNATSLPASATASAAGGMPPPTARASPGRTPQPPGTAGASTDAGFPLLQWHAASEMYYDPTRKLYWDAEKMMWWDPATNNYVAPGPPHS